MLHIGITGQAGFIGTHLHNFFGLQKAEVVRIPFEDSYFYNKTGNYTWQSFSHQKDRKVAVIKGKARIQLRRIGTEK
jgi:NAD dependent epimerase/dehydratase family enzyme